MRKITMLSGVKVYFITVLFLVLNIEAEAQKSRAFYLSSDGNDHHAGTKWKPWKTIEKLNSVVLRAGDQVFFKAGERFSGTILVDSTERGTETNPIRFNVSGNGKAIISSGEKEGLMISHSAFIDIRSLHFTGKGRKEGNTKNGVLIYDSKGVVVNNIDVEGYQKSGVSNFQSSGTQISGVRAFNNGYAGISVSGILHKKENSNIRITDCLAENNPGDPTILKNHSGNGIVVSHCTNVLIENCVATNNGWDMPRKGNGPVGIWAFEADSVLIQQCISYENKTSEGGGDGGGFDLDGGVTNSVIQYCLSYRNQGSGFGLFQYAWASNWHNNIIRNNISENDGTVTQHAGGIMIWNSSGDEKQLSHALVTGNIIYSDKKAAIYYDPDSQHGSFTFRNNVFIAGNEIIKGDMRTDIFEKNLFWSMADKCNISGGKDLTEWEKTATGKTISGNICRYPFYSNPGKTKIIQPSALKDLDNYTLPDDTDLIIKGFDLQTDFKKRISSEYNGH